MDNQKRIDEEASRRRSALNFVIGDILNRVDQGLSIEREDVRYFNFGRVKELPDPEAEIDRALRIVTTAKNTNTLEDLRAIIKK